jgi:hypothetical protein
LTEDLFYIQGTQVLYPGFRRSLVPDPYLVRIRAGMHVLFYFLIQK